MTTLADRAPIRRLAEILHAAMAFGPSMWNGGGEAERETIPQSAQLTNDLIALFSTLNEKRVAYLLVGGVALLKYIEGRNTDDVNLIIAMDGLPLVPEIEVQLRSKDTARGHFRSLRVDLLFTTNPVFELARRSHATTHSFSEVVVPCASAEGLILLKLYALPSLYLQGQLDRAALYENDILMLALRQKTAIRPLLRVLQRHLMSGEIEELSRIAVEIENRIERMRRSGSS